MITIITHHHHTTTELEFESLTSPPTLHFLSSHLRHPCHPCPLYHLPLPSCDCQPTHSPPPVIQHQRCHRRHPFQRLPPPRRPSRRRRSPERRSPELDGWNRRCRRLEPCRWAQGPGRPVTEVSPHSAAHVFNDKALTRHHKEERREHDIHNYTRSKNIKMKTGDSKKIPLEIIGPVRFCIQENLSQPFHVTFGLAWPTLDLQPGGKFQAWKIGLQCWVA